MDAEKLVIHQSCQRQAIEELHEGIVDALIVFLYAWLLRESYILCES